MIEHKAQCGRNGNNYGYQAAKGIAVISTLLLVPMACYIVYRFYNYCSSRKTRGYKNIDGHNNNPNEPINNDTENTEPIAD